MKFKQFLNQRFEGLKVDFLCEELRKINYLWKVYFERENTMLGCFFNEFG